MAIPIRDFNSASKETYSVYPQREMEIVEDVWIYFIPEARIDQLDVET